jgi:hypothetical protein
MKNVVVFLSFASTVLFLGCTDARHAAIAVPEQAVAPTEESILEADCSKVEEQELRDYCSKEQERAKVQRWRRTHKEMPAPRESNPGTDMPELPVDPVPPTKRPDPYPPGASTAPQRRQTVTAEFLPNGDEGCMPGWNLSIPNDSSSYLEVVGTDLRICDGEGVVEIFVSTPNGGTRTAYVIPPGVTGTYYFYPWRDAGGKPVSTKGKKSYTVNAYDAGSVRGLSPATPAAKLVAMKQSVEVPHVGVWWKNTITDQRIAEYRAMH